MATGTVERKPSWIQRLNLGWVSRLLQSSIGRKLIIGSTGLLLCGFLVVHLAGNLLIYGGKEAFDKYAHALHDQEWLPIAEFGLFALFVIHIYMAVTITMDNRKARQQRYAVKESKRADRSFSPAPSSWMFISGAIVLGFLVVHMLDMRLAGMFETHRDESAAFLNTMAVLMNPIRRIVYIIGTLILGFHLSHGFSSAFQSLGLNHPKYSPAIKRFGVVFAVVIALGFASLPLIVPHLPGLTKQFDEVREANPSTPTTVPAERH